MAEAHLDNPAPVRSHAGGVLMLHDPACIAHPDPALLTPAAHAGQASAESGRGGRGAVWFVSGSFGEAVLRHYRRGGLVARLLRDRYLYTSAERSRAFREFRLLHALRGRGLPVPRPLLAGVRPQGPWYSADILLERVRAARTLAECLPEPADVPWERVGAALARFHDAGAYHADLNAHNILLAGAEQAVWLIDFDRGALRPPGRWREANLARLRRSLRKLAGESVAEAGFARLQAGYRNGVPA